MGIRFVPLRDGNWGFMRYCICHLSPVTTISSVMKIMNFHLSRCCDPTGSVKSLKTSYCSVILNWHFCWFNYSTISSFRGKSPQQQGKPRMCVQGNLDLYKKKHSSSGLILYLLSSFLVISIL